MVYFAVIIKAKLNSCHMNLTERSGLEHKVDHTMMSLRGFKLLAV